MPSLEQKHLDGASMWPHFRAACDCNTGRLSPLCVSLARTNFASGRSRPHAPRIYGVQEYLVVELAVQGEAALAHEYSTQFGLDPARLQLDSSQVSLGPLRTSQI